jgi:hypothetical protein
MYTLVELVFDSVNTIFDHANVILSSLSVGGSGLTLAFALGTTVHGDISEGVYADIRRWHGSIDDQFSNIDNVVNQIVAHKSVWTVPDGLLNTLSDNRDRLQTLINKCRTSQASSADRTIRNTLLKSTVGICLFDVKIWAYNEFTAGVMTVDDVHLLGFLLPGETGRHRGRTEATDVVAEVKVKVVNEDFVRVVVDQSAGENAAQVVHGWPAGVKNILIVITSADGTTEVYRQMSSRLHNDIRMPEGSHGKQFIIKAAFLKHVDDEPRFGNEPTFSMPLTTADLAAALDSQHHQEYEERLREVERHRQEIERLLDNMKTDETKA